MALIAELPHKQQQTDHFRQPTPRASVRDEIDWKSLDWSRSDQKLANNLGINKAHVAKARQGLHKLPSTYGKTNARRLFRNFLRDNGKEASTLSLLQLIDLSGVDISASAAYRVALSMNVRGKRKNKSKYDPFWGQLNWELPDSDLAAIWEIERGNIQMKRKVLVRRRTPGVPRRAKWTRLEFRTNKTYQGAVTAEKAKRREYHGPRPS